MGNSVSPCFYQNSPSSSSSVKLIFWEGTTKILNGKHIAGEIMFESPDKMVCHADSFFIGRPIPSLAIDDDLMPGQTYFVLPIDRFACGVLTASSLASLSSSPNKPGTAAVPINFGGDQCRPFEYIRGENGRVLIKVVPEFITKLINRGKEIESSGNNSSNELLCSTPELKKHYDQLVGSREQIWSPKLETISEYKNIRFSPCKFIGFEWKQKEKTVIY
ncbi:DUF4228 domain-containing protein [Melia azedarach]|uniref:DUF4228 domain-containing protein n=1 Tax=Melia azedarach TaxID=155640 RepID=A0ACC1YLW9_MELAZ|nr:DUF4228 domain-containing protein [Melia azedarach]